jgi:hypothetical protein
VAHVRLGRLDQVGDQVVPALQLHVDLAEGVLVAVAQGDEIVVDPHREQRRQADDDQGGDRRDRQAAQGE